MSSIVRGGGTKGRPLNDAVTLRASSMDITVWQADANVKRQTTTLMASARARATLTANRVGLGNRGISALTGNSDINHALSVLGRCRLLVCPSKGDCGNSPATPKREYYRH